MARIIGTLWVVCLFTWAQSPIESVSSGCALKFTPQDYVCMGDVLDNYIAGPGKQFTLEFWFYIPETSNATLYTFISTYAYCNSERQIELRILNNRMEFCIYPPASTSGRHVATDLTNYKGRWNHFALVYDGTQPTTLGRVKMYMNGIALNTYLSYGTNTPLDIVYSPSQFCLAARVTGGGTRCSSDNQLEGIMDEVRLWSYNRSLIEVRQTMCRRLTGNEAGLVGYWRLDECIGNIAFDATTNANHGTLY